jgi:hypothetical protein
MASQDYDRNSKGSFEEYDPNQSEYGGEAYYVRFRICVVVYKKQNPNVIAWATALYPYEAAAEGELSFQEGDVIGILEEHEDGWTRGELNNIEGLFPASYVQKSDAYDANTSYDQTYTQEPNQPDKEKSRKIRDKLR